MAALRAIPPLKDEIVDVLGLHYSFDVPSVRHPDMMTLTDRPWA